MDAIRKTDFFAVIPVVGLLPELVISRHRSDEAWRGRVIANLSLLALAWAAATMVASVILNWSY